MENEKKQSASIKTPHNNHQKQSPFFNGHPAGVAQKAAEPFFNPNPQNAFFNPTAAPTVQTKTDATHTPPTTKSENKTGMPDNLKTGVENLSGVDISDVKVHYNSKKPTELNAHAYAQGSDIHVAAGQEKYLAHEAWHVVQQKQGRVQPTVQMKTGVAVNDDTGLEQEADVMGEKVSQSTIQNKNIQQSQHLQASTIQRSQVMQLKLNTLTAENLELEMGKNEHPTLTALLGALKVYQSTPDTDPINEAKAFDEVVKQHKLADSALEYEVLEKDNTKLDPVLTWLGIKGTELEKERDNLVRRLPIVSKLKEMMALFPDLSRMSIGNGIEDLVAAEPKIPENKDGINYEESVANKPFNPDGPQVNDVVQGMLGDCWLLAPLISLVNTAEGKARIFNMIQPNNVAAEVYIVTLFERDENFLPRQIPVLARFPMLELKKEAKVKVFTYANADLRKNDSPPLWVPLIEKAFAILIGKGYKGLNGNKKGSKAAYESILGKKAPSTHPVGETINEGEMRTLAAKGVPMVVSTDTHYWSVVEPIKEGINLRNPHGHDDFKTWAELKKDFTYQASPT